MDAPTPDAPMPRHLIPLLAALALALLPVAARADAPQTSAWQQYADLHFLLGGSAGEPHVDWRMQRAHGEFKATIAPPDGDPVTQFVIPSGVYLSRGLPEEQTHTDAPLEFTGLQGQLLLLLLEEAFPEGPESVTAQARTRTVTEREKDHAIHFMGGGMEVHPAWRAEVTAQRRGDGRIDFELTYALLDDDTSHLHAKGTWTPGPGDWVLPDAEPLKRWTVNYFGTTSVDAAGHPHFETPLGDTSGFTTLGDVRRAMAGAK